jgi:pentose-5-phosphate-3-epimerase
MAKIYAALIDLQQAWDSVDGVKAIRELAVAGIDGLHLDAIINGASEQEVSSSTFLPAETSRLVGMAKRFRPDMAVDVHLFPTSFISANSRYMPTLIDDYRSVGATAIILPYEAYKRGAQAGRDMLAEHLKRIKQHGGAKPAKAGVSFTHAEITGDLLADIGIMLKIGAHLDYFHLQGQMYDAGAMIRLKELAGRYARASKLMADGGVTENNAKQLRDAGAEILVMGEALLKSPALYLKQLRRQLV